MYLFSFHIKQKEQRNEMLIHIYKSIKVKRLQKISNLKANLITVKGKH